MIIITISYQSLFTESACLYAEKVSHEKVHTLRRSHVERITSVIIENSTDLIDDLSIGNF